MGGKTRLNLARGLVQSLEELAPVLARHETRHAVIGGIAVIANGVQRLTRDIDLAFVGGETDFSELADELAQVGIVPRIDNALAFAAESQVLLAQHTETLVEIDISRAWLPFELEAIAAARTTKLAGLTIRTAVPEDLVIYKAVAWRPQDVLDVERLLALHGDRMDLGRIRGHVRELGEAMEQDRLRELDAMIRRVLDR